MLRVEADFTQPSLLHVCADELAELAAIPDRLLAAIAPVDAMVAAWALHPSEQAGHADEAYRDERAEIGATARWQIEELSRPRQPNVVWVDRYHLLVAGAPASSATRLLGLYVGSAGRAVLFVHHPSISGQVEQALVDMPASGAAGWLQTAPLAHFAVSYQPQQQQSIDVFVSPAHAAAASALQGPPQLFR